LIAEAAAVWAVSRGRQRDTDRLNRLRAELLADIEALKPAVTSSDQAPLSSDPIHGVAQGLVQNLLAGLGDANGYGSLAAFVGENLPKQLGDVEQERWHLLGPQGPPTSLGAIRATLSKLHAVLAELAWSDTGADAIANAARGVQEHRALDGAATLARRRADARYQHSLSRLTELAAEIGVTVRPFSRDAGATVWPATATALVIDLPSIQDLEPSLAAVAGLLDQVRLPDRSVTLVPALEGKVLPRLSATAFPGGNLYPTPGAADEWTAIVPTEHETPLTDAAVRAHQALQELSGLAYLARCRDVADSLDEAAADALSQWREASEEVAALPEDGVTAEILGSLQGLADRVQAELDGDGTEPCFAEAVVLGAKEPNGEYAQLSGMVLVVATAWDVDPAAAAELLAQ
jgi:hypothetical protein